MDPKTQQQLDEMEVKVDEINTQVKKIRLYMQITAWVTVVVFVLPLIGLLFAVPAMLSSYQDAMSLLQY